MSSSDVQIKIIGKDEASNSFRKVREEAEKVATSMANVSNSASTMKNIFTGTMSAMLGFAGIEGITSSLNSSIEAAKEFYTTMETGSISMAGTLVSMTTINGQTLSWGQSLSMSKELMRQLNDQAVLTGSSTREISDVFRAMLPASMNAGMSIKQTMELASTLTTTGKALGLNGNLLMRDAADLVTGKNAQRTKLGSVLGISDEDIAKAKTSAGGLYGFLTERLQGEKEANEHYLNSLEGRINHLKEAVARVGGTALTPVFEGANSILTDIANKLVTVDDETKEVTVNPEILDDMKEITDTAIKFGGELKNIGNELSVAVVPAAKLLGAGLQYAAENAQVLVNVAGIWIALTKAQSIYQDVQAVAKGSADAQSWLGKQIQKNRDAYTEQAAKAVQAAKAEEDAALRVSRAQSNMNMVKTGNDARETKASSRVDAATLREDTAKTRLASVQEKNAAREAAAQEKVRLAAVENRAAAEQRLGIIQKENMEREQVAAAKVQAATSSRIAAEAKLAAVQESNALKEQAAIVRLNQATAAQAKLTAAASGTAAAQIEAGNAAMGAGEKAVAGADAGRVSQVALTESVLAAAGAQDAAGTAAEVAGAKTVAAADGARIAETGLTESIIAEGDAQLAAGTGAEEKGIRTAAAAEESIAAESALTDSILVQTDAHLAAGTEAEATGIKTAEGAIQATTAEGVLTESVIAATEAHTAAGIEAEATGVKSVSALEAAKASAIGLKGELFALVGGWVGVAAAIGYATYKLYEWYNADKKTKQEHTYTVDDVEYREKDGQFYKVRQGYNPTGAPDELVEDSDTNEKLQAAWWERHKDDKDYLAQLEKEAAADEAEKRKAEIEVMRAKYANGPEANSAAVHPGKSAAATQKSQTYEQDVPIGEIIAQNAAAHPEGEQWMGNITNDPAIQCDSFTANVYNQAGISSIGGVSTDGSVINDSAFRAAGAYHPAGDGYQPSNGDLVDFDGHVGIYKDGKIISRQSSAGVHTASMEEAESYFGAIRGFGSIAEASGGKTVNETLSSDGKAAYDALKKLNDAKKEYATLFSTMENTIGDETNTAYENGMNKVADDVRRKQQEINKLAAAGLDTTAITGELKDYEKITQQKVIDQHNKAMSELKESTASTLDAVRSDYEAAANDEFAATVRKLQDERKEKVKAVAETKGDYEAQLAIDQWYNAQLMEANKKRDEELRESHRKYMNDLVETGNMTLVISALEHHPGKERESLQYEGQKKLAKEYVTLWDNAHESIAGFVKLSV